MNETRCVAAAIVATLFAVGPLTAFAQQDQSPILKPKKAAGATILVICDLACNWRMDGEAMGSLADDGSKKIPVSLGQHLLQASSQDGLDKVEKEVEIKSAAQAIVHLELKPIRDARIKPGEKTPDKASQEQQRKAAVDQFDKERALWDAIKESGHAEDFRGYLDKYPDGAFATIAKRRIVELAAAKDWEAIKNSKDANDYKAFLETYPSSTFSNDAKRAEERLAKIENLQGSTWDVQFTNRNTGPKPTWTGALAFGADGSCILIGYDGGSCHWLKQGEVVTTTYDGKDRVLCAQRWGLIQNGGTMSGQATWVNGQTGQTTKWLSTGCDQGVSGTAVLTER